MSETVCVCVDCRYWLECGRDDPYAVWPEGYSGPELLEPLSNYWTAAVCDSEGEPLEPHYSRSQCEGCGSGLAGDRFRYSVEAREESVL